MPTGTFVGLNALVDFKPSLTSELDKGQTQNIFQTRCQWFARMDNRVNKLEEEEDYANDSNQDGGDDDDENNGFDVDADDNGDYDDGDDEYDGMISKSVVKSMMPVIKLN